MENFFAKEKMTLFMVTHDRYFLERVCNEIVELDQGTLYSYKGNYSYFLEKKQQRIQQEQASQEKAKTSTYANWTGYAASPRLVPPKASPVSMTLP